MMDNNSDENKIAGILCILKIPAKLLCAAVIDDVLLLILCKLRAILRSSGYTDLQCWKWLVFHCQM